MPTLHAFTEFIEINRGSSAACRGWTKNEIENEIVNVLESGCLCCDCDPITDEIYGVVICYPDKQNMLLHIKAMIVKKNISGIVYRILQRFYELFPNYTIQAYRKQILKQYKNTHRLCKLLEIISL